MSKRPFFVPEVIQTSGMDCGPAALKALLSGLGVQVSYARLRDACRTSADGTSIEALEELCCGLGLDAFQEIAPLGDAIEILAKRAPCIAAVTSATSSVHFVVVWRRLGPWLQIMDPARGRRWVHADMLTRTLHVHLQRFDDETFRGWFPSTAWSTRLQERLRALGAASLLLPDASAKELCALDAAARVVDRAPVRSAMPRSAHRRVVENLAKAELATPGLVPAPMHSSAPYFDGSFAVRGTVFLAIREPDGPRDANASARDATSSIARTVLGPDGPRTRDVVLRQLTVHGRRLAVLLALLAAFVAVASLSEMIVLRAAFNARLLLSLPLQRFAGTAIYGLLVLVLLGAETVLAIGIARVSRALELRTRLALLLKLPRLADRYFRTRPMSDVAHRSQGLFQVKPLPELLVTLVKQSLDILVTVVALAILYPRGLPFTGLALLFSFVVPYLSVKLRWQVENRVLSHAGALAQLYLDVLRGLNPLRTHGGAIAIRTKQEGHLVEWRNEAHKATNLLSLTEAIQSGGTLIAIVALLLSYLRSSPDQGDLLLMAFWSLRLPLYARSLASTMQRVPGIVAAMDRLVEPLTAEETVAGQEVGESTQVFSNRGGMALRFDGVRVVLSTHEVLSRVSLSIKAGEHVAIVGNSGAGKSSLLAVLLGILECEEGAVFVDGVPAERYDLARLRRECVWVDPGVQLWDRPLVDNLCFGNPLTAREPLTAGLDAVDLGDLLERLPEGLATHLGESGCRVSGGEGQRVRLGRAFLRRGARLVLLDEAFRGLERATRRRLSRAVRTRGGGATVIEVTHDVADTHDYHRVVVIEDGRVVEEGAPGVLLASSGSRYRALVEADQGSGVDVWEAEHWKRVKVSTGQVELGRVDG